MKFPKLDKIEIQWRSVAAVSLIVVFAIVLLGYKLDSLVGGLSLDELVFVKSASSVQSIIANPLFITHKIPLYLLEQLGVSSILSARLVSALFALGSALLLYKLIKQWHTRRIAVITSLLFVSSSWFLQLGRVASPEISYVFMPLLLIYLGFELRQRTNLWFCAALGIASALALYVPGLIWLVFALGLMHSKQLHQAYKAMPRVPQAVFTLLGVLLLVPLIYATVKNVQVGLEMLGIMQEITPTEWAKRFVLIPVFLTAQGPFMPTINLGRLPLLDVFSVVIVIMGGYWCSFKLRLLRTRTLLTTIAVISALIVFGGLEYLAMLLPIVFMLVAAGLSLLLQQWFTVFPKNPLARGLGTILIAAAILVVGTYHIQRYFVAWSGAQATRRLFIHQIKE